jgi:hypothetical protein
MKKYHFQIFSAVEFHQSSTNAWLSHFTTDIYPSEIYNNKPVFGAIDAFMGKEENSVTLPDSLEFDSSDYWEAVAEAHDEIMERLYTHLKKQLAPITPDGWRPYFEPGNPGRVYINGTPHDVQGFRIRTVPGFNSGK